MIRRGSLAAALTAGTALAVVAVSVGTSMAAYHHSRQQAELAGRASGSATSAQSQAASRTANQASAKAAKYYAGAISSHLAGFDKMVGAKADLTVNYVAWGRPVSELAIEHDATLGARVMEILEPYSISLAKIVAGKGDSYLRTFAERIVASGGHVLVSFAPEMNGDWYSWGYHHVTAAEYVKAYRHVHEVVSKIAGHEVSWVWQVSHAHHNTAPLRRLWPGKAYVNMVGVDGYFSTPSDTFANVLGNALHALRKFTGKVPIMVTETAAGQQANKAAKIRLIFAGVRQWHLRGLIYFDHSPWQLAGNKPAISAFKAGLRSLGIKVR